LRQSRRVGIFFPAYFGAGGIVASPNDMLQWLLFNMGINQYAGLTPLRPVLQQPSTSVKFGDNQNGGVEIPAALANDILLIMQGITPPADKSAYPRAVGRRRAVR
jgi:hypothetical protein